jgi:hypothetical protein
MSRLIILAPTWKRPESAARLRASVYAMSPGAHLMFLHGEEPTAVKMNRAAPVVAKHFDYIGFLGDDALPVTPDWDEMLIDAITGMGGTGLACPRSDTRPGHPEHYIVSSDMVRALGWMFLPSLKHYYTDDVWRDLATGLGRLAYVEAAYVDHRHFTRGAPKDEVYQRSEAWGPQDRLAYLAWRVDGFYADLAKLEAVRDAHPVARA